VSAIVPRSKETAVVSSPTWLFIREEGVGKDGQLASIYGTHKDMAVFVRAHIESLKNNGLPSWPSEIQLFGLEKDPMNTFAAAVAIDVLDSLDDSVKVRKAFAETVKSLSVPYLLIKENKSSRLPFGSWMNVNELSNVLSQSEGLRS